MIKVNRGTTTAEGTAKKHITLTAQEQNLVHNLVTIHGSTRRNAVKLVYRRRLRRNHGRVQHHGNVSQARKYFLTWD